MQQRGIKAGDVVSIKSLSYLVTDIEPNGDLRVQEINPRVEVVSPLDTKIVKTLPGDARGRTRYKTIGSGQMALPRRLIGSDYAKRCWNSAIRNSAVKAVAEPILSDQQISSAFHRYIAEQPMSFVMQDTFDAWLKTIINSQASRLKSAIKTSLRLNDPAALKIAAIGISICNQHNKTLLSRLL